ncbi:MAG TPA: peptidoglycan DD-metalloendopeptidase family protein [Steroidobacteraceae bacterium]|nr:peptidoglycan DD-metalloendopeptidase family protein [Steroidobacteraceae bacterium]
MGLNFKLLAHALGSLGRAPSASFWLQASACAVVGWTLLHQATIAPPDAGTADSQLALEADRADGRRDGGAGTAPPSVAPAPGATQAPPTPAVQLAAAPSLADAKLALSTIDVIVTRNDTLDRIFRRLKLSLADLASLRSLPGVRANLDSLHPGESLHFTHREGQIFGLERRLNESQTLKVSRDDAGLKADVLQNPLEVRARTVRGVIETSLFEAVEAAGAHDQTAVALADIFGWDIDFVLDVRPGDAFVVTYQEIWRDGAYVKDGPIQAAEFVNQGHEFRAVRYTDPEGGSHYYTPDGRSLHKEFLRAPVEFTRISSRFNSARLHPILNLIRAHKGVDYAAPIGTPVHAAGDGRIRFAGWQGGYGNVVEIEHSRSIVTVYGHLSGFARGTHVGTRVTQGTVIAYVGMTGLATGPHLHYEYRVNGVFKNPQTVALAAAAPIDARWREDFLARSTPLLASLELPGPMLVSR